MFSAIWPSAPKRTSTPKPPPLPPKLTTTTTASPSSSSSGYPPHHQYHSAHDAPWEHVKHGSPSSPDGDGDDEATFERLGYSHVEHDDNDDGGGNHPRGLSVPPARTRQEETDRSRQRLEAPHKKPESTCEREREKERENSAATVAVVDALLEENEKLKTMVKQQVQQMDVVREKTKQERSQMESEVEGELKAAREAHKGEVEALKMGLQEHAERLEYLTTDRERVRKDRESIKGNLTAEIERLKLTHARETEQFRTTLEEANHDRTMAHSELRNVRKSLDAYTPKLDESLGEIEILRRELSNMKDSNRMAAELQQRLEIQSKELYSAREESSALRKNFNQLATFLEDRTSELKGVQTFLTTADAFSGAEVTSTLQRLNAETLQTTAFMAESMVELFFHERMIQVSKTDEQLAASKRASGAIGGVVVHFLGTKKHTDDPILIQIAFQACLTYHLRWITRAWIIGGDEGHNRFIDEIYQGMHEKETQAIAGRWRALTRAYAPLTPSDNSQITSQMANKIISSLSDILLTTGCTVPKSDIASALSSKFADKLSFLISLAIRVNKIVGGDITSGDFEVMAIPPATAFDVTTMEDSYDYGGSIKARTKKVPKVLCATDLGLRKKTPVGSSGEKKWETKVLLKPKVALESVIDILDE